MRAFRNLLVAAAVLATSSVGAFAQSACPYLAYGAVLTAAQWNACFEAKLDVGGGGGFLPLSGGTMTGKLTTVATTAAASGFTLPPGTPPFSPSNGDLWTTSAGLFAYINGTTVGPFGTGSASLVAHTPVNLVTTVALPANTYNNGSSGVGATLTENSNGALSVDGVAVAVNNRIAVIDEATAANNGIYLVTATGSVSAPYVLTRSSDANTPGTNSATAIGDGTYVLVTAGNTQTNSSWIVNSTVNTIGTSAINWVQFSGPFSGVASLGGKTGSISINSTLAFAGSTLGVVNVLLPGTGSGATTFASPNAGSSNYTATIPANTGTLAELNIAQSFTQPQTFPASGIDLLGSSTGYTTFGSANAGATNYTATFPANTGAVAEINFAQSWSAAQTYGSNYLICCGGAATAGLATVSSSGVISSEATASVPQGGTGQATFTANLPLIGNGTAALAQGTISGNTTEYGTVAGSLVSGDCVSIDTNKNLVDAGGPCTTGGGGGTVNHGNAGNVAYYASSGTAVSGNANMNVSGGALTLGLAGSVVGSLIFDNATSGGITVAPPTGALGTQTLTLPDGTGTIASENLAQEWTALQIFLNSDLALMGTGSGYTIFSSQNTSGTIYTLSIPPNTGTLAEINYAQSWTAPQTFAANDLICCGGSTTTGVGLISSAGVVTSGTTLPSGLTIPAPTITGSLTATGLVTNSDLQNSAITIGSTTMSLGSTYSTINGALTFGGALTFSGLGSGTQTSCLGLTSGNQVVPSTGACGGGSSGVTSLNSLTGALSIVAGSGITVTPSGTNITVAATGGSGSNPTGISVAGNTTISPVSLLYSVIVTGNSAGVTETLPAAPTQWQIVNIADGACHSATYNITISGNGKNINFTASTSMTLATNCGNAELQYDGTQWDLI